MRMKIIVNENTLFERKDFDEIERINSIIREMFAHISNIWQGLPSDGTVKAMMDFLKPRGVKHMAQYIDHYLRHFITIPFNRNGTNMVPSMGDISIDLTFSSEESYGGSYNYDTGVIRLKNNGKRQDGSEFIRLIPFLDKHKRTTLVHELAHMIDATEKYNQKYAEDKNNRTSEFKGYKYINHIKELEAHWKQSIEQVWKSTWSSFIQYQKYIDARYTPEQFISQLNHMRNKSEFVDDCVYEFRINRANTMKAKFDIPGGFMLSIKKRASLLYDDVFLKLKKEFNIAQSKLKNGQN